MYFSRYILSLHAHLHHIIIHILIHIPIFITYIPCAFIIIIPISCIHSINILIISPYAYICFHIFISHTYRVHYLYYTFHTYIASPCFFSFFHTYIYLMRIHSCMHHIHMFIVYASHSYVLQFIHNIHMLSHFIIGQYSKAPPIDNRPVLESTANR